MTHATATVDLMRPPFPAEPGSGVYSNKLGMWVFLASDVMFFTALIGSYIVLRFGMSSPWAKRGAGFVSVQLIEYIKLVGHGFTPTGYREGSLLAEHAAGDPLKYGAAVAGMYGSTFFTMTGFHGFHVTCGVISMTYLYLTKALPGKYSKNDYGGIETVGLYWHFVDLVWIILFTIVYLI